MALRYGSRIPPFGFKIADKRSEHGVYVDVKQGGTLIEYADEPLLASPHGFVTQTKRRIHLHCGLYQIFVHYFVNEVLYGPIHNYERS